VTEKPHLSPSVSGQLLRPARRSAKNLGLSPGHGQIIDGPQFKTWSQVSIQWPAGPSSLLKLLKHSVSHRKNLSFQSFSNAYMLHVTVTVTVTVTDNLFRHEFQKKPRPSPLSARTITQALFKSSNYRRWHEVKP
jgi:hypothetical protein